MEDMTELEGVARRADQASRALCKAVDWACVALMALLVIDVWLGVFARYVMPLPITFMEEAARYLMIWVALLAVSSGIARREHIGVQMVFVYLPPAARRALLALVDVLAIVFFGVLVWYGIGMVERGERVSTMIYGMSKMLPFAAVPVSAALALMQLVLVAVRDQARLARTPDVVVCP
jgi:TRAP-type C4-dicarboxylate transport system permease small subunit